MGYTWRSTTELPFIPGIRARIIAPGYRCGYKSLVHRDYRGHQLYGAVTRFWEHNFVAAGITRTIGYVARHNLASLRGVDRVGTWRRLGHLIAIPKLRIKGQPFVWCSGAARESLAFEAAEDYASMV